MPPRSVEYTLVGFSAELDCRPLRFVKPIPSHTVCDACGLVRRRTALLPCRHTLCESCYELSNHGNRRVCPLDSHKYKEENVDLKAFPAGELLKREVKCWNEGNGCKAVLLASQVAQHSQRECRHPSVRCPRCSATVLCTDGCAHLESGCCTTAVPAGLQRKGDSGRMDETALRTSVRQILEEESGEIKALLARLLTGAGTNATVLNGIDYGVNYYQDALRKELRQGISSVNDTIKLNVAQMRKDHRDGAEKFSDEIAAFSEETEQSSIASSGTSKSISSRMHVLEKQLSGQMTKFATKNPDKVLQTAAGSEKPNEQQIKCNRATDHMHAVSEPFCKPLFSNFPLWSAEFRVARENPDTSLQFGGGSWQATGPRVEANRESGRLKVVPKTLYRETAVCKVLASGVKSVQRKARRHGSTIFGCGPLYLRGYCIIPGFRVYRMGETFTPRAWFRLHKGDLDDVVGWPFQQTIILIVLHPNGGADRELVQRTNREYACCQRPQDGCVQYPFLSFDYLVLEDLIHYGYVKDDKLFIKFLLSGG